MTNLIQNMAGLGNITEQIVAQDLLLATKTGIRSYSIALSEAATPEVRNVLRRHLNDAVDFHEKITNFMLQKGWYQAYNPQELIQMDMQASQTVLSL